MSLASGDLTTLAAAKGYVDPLPADAVLSGLISRLSMMIRSTLNRSYLFPRSYTEQFGGQFTKQLVLPHYPVLGTPKLTIDGTVVPVAPQPNANQASGIPWGFRFQPWNGLPPGAPAVLELVGGITFWGGRQNVVVTYEAGYQVTNEAQTIPSSPFTLPPLAPYGTWATDQGVTFAATGQALTAIASGVPVAGQYLPPAPDLPSPRLVYTFAAADTGKGVLLSYGFIPADIEQAALELIAERASYRTRVGIRSRSLASQEIFSYDDAGLNKWIIDALWPYVSVLPPPIGAPV